MILGKNNFKNRCMWWLWGLLAIPVFFLLIFWNDRRNRDKLYKRQGRNFRENYFKKKEKR
ncbi:hypothetical protein CGC48_00880 [Capnocytophaga cynodegmi]|uniref:Uncharacterized protein n=1 Tax=Capnocytophaga cynodegmi TaxID=28189 RepID=A0A250E6D0_9FLAO|nr:hypothetical protein CGC48_00880 [Capnocytophaga cynodegmi]